MKEQMGHSMNILLTSVGRRSYLVKYFKEVVGENGEVHVSNSNEITPAFIFADKSTVTPLIYENRYIPFLLDYCVENNISAIISLFDVDLPILSANRQSFEDIGVRVIVSDEAVINVCNDKWETYKFLISNGFNAPKTYVSLELAIKAIRTEEVRFPVMLKPRWGMGSIAVIEVENEHELEVLYNKVISNIMGSYLKYESQVNFKECVIIQEKLRGQEYGLDVINNLEGEYQNTIVKKKYAMRSGETDCAETIYSPVLRALGKAISKKLHHVANLDMDVFVDNDKPFVLELNARFGGGYPFSHIAGVNLPLAIVKWLRSEEVDVSLLTERTGILAHKDIEIGKLSLNKNIHCIGWIPSEKVYDWFLASDLAVFPGTHSVLWEQAVACGVPCVFKHWDGMEHVDVGGNCKFLYNDSIDEIKNILLDIVKNKDNYEKMKNVAIKKGVNEFSYLEIAKRSINFSSSEL
jgi:carbamoylphosphate synthase large subunit